MIPVCFESAHLFFSLQLGDATGFRHLSEMRVILSLETTFEIAKPLLFMVYGLVDAVLILCVCYSSVFSESMREMMQKFAKDVYVVSHKWQCYVCS